MGYLFIDPEGKQIPIGLSMSIGSDPACDIVVTGPDISPKHVIIGMFPDGLLIRDEDSVSGTFVNGERLEHVNLLKPGDRVRVGSAEFTVKTDNASQPPQTSGAPETQAVSASGLAKKKSSGGCLRIGLTIILIMLLACIVLGAGGYLLVKNGVIPKRMVDEVTGYSMSQVHFYNFTDKDVVIEVKEDVEEGTMTIPFIFLTLKPYESYSKLSYAGTGEWNNLKIGSAKDTYDLGQCRFFPDGSYDYNIIIMPDRVLIDEIRYPRYLDKLPSKGSDLIMATSPLCKPDKSANGGE